MGYVLAMASSLFPFNILAVETNLFNYEIIDFGKGKYVLIPLN